MPIKKNEEQTCLQSQPVQATVVIPVYNDGNNLKRCLAALAASTFDGFDVVVIDDGSTEPIRTVVESYGNRYLRVEGPGGPARARNYGVQQVQSEWIIFIDADVCVHEDTLERFVRQFQATPDLVGVVGTYDDAPESPGLISQYRNLYHRYTHCQSAGPITTFWCGCGAMRRDVFLKYGGFDEARYPRPMIEDIELGTWVAAGGGIIELDPTIQCKHLKRWSLVNMVRTDICQRGIVWIDLMLRSRKVITNLNVSRSQRLSVGLVFASLGMIVGAIWWPHALIGVVILLALVTLINMKLYTFLTTCRGLGFAIRSLPLHWLYFISCGVSVLVGTPKHFLTRRKQN